MQEQPSRQPSGDDSRLANPQTDGHDELRILEIGHFTFSKSHLPAQTTLVWTGVSPSNSPLPDEPLTLPSFVRLLRGIRDGAHDIVIIYVEQWAPWHRKHLRHIFSRNPLRTLLKLSLIQCLRFVRPRTPVMVLDITEWGIVHRYNEFLLDKCAIWFKRELPADRWRVFRRASGGGFPATRFRRRARNRRRLEKIHPMSIGTFLAPTERAFPEKTTDTLVAVSGTNSSTIRVEGLRQFKSLQDAGINVDMTDQRLDQREFYARMSQAWLIWSPHGFGWDCFRHYEAPLCYSVPVMSMVPIIRQFPLLEGEHAFYYLADEADGLARTVRRALADKDRLRQMAIAANALVVRHHLWPGRIEELIAMARGRQQAPGGILLD